MIFVHYYDEYEYENNPDGFKMPYQYYGKRDREIKENKYFNLRPISLPLKKRLIGTVYGGCSFK